MSWDAGNAKCTGSPTVFSNIADAQSAVDQFNASFSPPLTGTASWRIANVDELRLLLSTSASSAPKTYDTLFPQTPADKFWSNTKFSISKTVDTGSFIIDFATGETTVSPTNGKYIRLITGYEPGDTFVFQVVPSDHSLVIDVGRNGDASNTGRIFSRCTFGMTWDESTQSCTGTATVFNTFKDADMAVANFNASGGQGGFTDWRIADQNELGSLTPGPNYPPATAPFIHAIFPQTPAAKFWSSKSFSIFGQWLIDFNVRGAPAALGTDGKYMRLLRGGNDVIVLTVTPQTNGGVDRTIWHSTVPGEMYFIAQPDLGYRVKGTPQGNNTCRASRDLTAWNPDGSSNSNAFKISGASKSCNVTLEFERIPDMWFVTSATAPVDGSGGTLDCSPGIGKKDETLTCNAAPAQGWRTQSIQGCQGPATTEGVNSFTTGALAADCAVTAAFAPIYGLSLTQPANATIACTRTDTGAAVVDGDALISGTPLQCTTTPASGYVLTGWSGDCAASGNAGTCSFTTSSAAATISATVVKADKTFSGTTVPATGAGGTAVASFTGGGAACRFDASATGFVAAPAEPPEGQTTPQGMFQFKLIDCDTTPVTVNIVWPGPVNGVQKYGKANATASASSYFAPTAASASGNTTSFTVTDGQLGDDDWTLNGVIIDPVLPTVAVPPPPTPVPALSTWALMLLSLLAASLGWRQMRRARP
ncbi:IPTL-CTERM sorting domain-containing protein [Diaphorobacter caeni]|uniref:IPTL-CTERM sorting domain-containing protein n=1 Tax=Diaphorobacter caeni TaxID=2784387 RepID=UPI0018906901|nr:IPTL-CTERM sorting domain-containing protein [Diaphorobacter caeni]MBF5005249.1 IPTL-CTERM sorting domain-containing protein [Diaphorobacter caeni]